MHIIVKYENKNYDIEIPENSSISNLQNEIYKITEVPVKSQKIILRGKIISNEFKPKQKITKYKINAGMRLMLLNTGQKDEKPQLRRAQKQRVVQKVSRKMSESKDNTIDKSIVEKGPPPDCEKGTKATLPKFPKNPFTVYDSSGNLFHLSIEQDSIWVNQIVDDDQKGKQERIFCSDISFFDLVDIPEYKYEYVVLSILAKRDLPQEYKNKFYFIPYQYTKAFTDFLTSTKGEQG